MKKYNPYKLIPTVLTGLGLIICVYNDLNLRRCLKSLPDLGQSYLLMKLGLALAILSFIYLIYANFTQKGKRK